MKDKIKEVRIGLRAQTQFEKLRKNTEERQGSKAAGQFVDDFEKTKNQLKRTPDILTMAYVPTNVQ